MARRRGEAHGEPLRVAMLDAAGALLHSEGPQALTTRRLADAVGTSTQAIYTLFGGKEGIVRAMYREGFDRLEQCLAEVPSAAAPPDYLLGLGRAYRTAALRSGLPENLSHKSAAVAAGRGALLGAALAIGDADLFVQSTADVLHEPFRIAESPLFAQLKADPPPGVRAVTLSGSGPTAIAWVAADEAAEVRERLAELFGEATVSVLAAAATGVVAREVVAR